MNYICCTYCAGFGTEIDLNKIPQTDRGFVDRDVVWTEEMSRACSYCGGSGKLVELDI